MKVQKLNKMTRNTITQKNNLPKYTGDNRFIGQKQDKACGLDALNMYYNIAFYGKDMKTGKTLPEPNIDEIDKIKDRASDVYNYAQRDIDYFIEERLNNRARVANLLDSENYNKTISQTDWLKIGYTNKHNKKCEAVFVPWDDYSLRSFKEYKDGDSGEYDIYYENQDGSCTIYKGVNEKENHIDSKTYCKDFLWDYEPITYDEDIKTNGKIQINPYNSWDNFDTDLYDENLFIGFTIGKHYEFDADNKLSLVQTNIVDDFNRQLAACQYEFKDGEYVQNSYKTNVDF